MKKYAVMLLCIQLISAALCGQVTEWNLQGEGILQGGTYYSLYDDTEYSKTIIGTGTDLHTYGLTVPCDQLTFEAKKDNWAANGDIYVQADGTQVVTPQSVSTSYTLKGAFSIPRATGQLTFRTKSGSLKRYIRNVHLTMASYVDAPSASSLNFGNLEVDDAAQEQTFTFDWCNAGTIRITYAGDIHFKVEESACATEGKYGTTIVRVQYVPTSAGEHVGTITISNGTQTHTVMLTGATYKHTPAMTWKDHLSPMQVGAEVVDAATMSNGGNLSYISSDENVLRVEGNKWIALSGGHVTITAIYAGDDKYEALSETRDITVTALQTQYILWTQSFLRLNVESTDVRLTAVACLVENDLPTGEVVTYKVGNPDVATLYESGGTYWLHIVGIGETTLTASCAGTEQYAAAEDVVLTLVVRDKTEGCEALVYGVTEGERLYTIANGVEIELQGEPEYLTFDAMNSKWGVFPASGNLKVRQKVDGVWSGALWQDPLKENEYQSYGPILLDRRATHIQFYTETGATCYHTYTNVAVTLAKYLESDKDMLNFTASVGAKALATITVAYSNIPNVLYVDIIGADADMFRVSTDVLGSGCGDKGIKELQVEFIPAIAGTAEAVLHIATEEMVLDIPLQGNAQQTMQEILWQPAQTDYTTSDRPVLDAVATSGLTVRYESSNVDVADVTEEGILVGKRAGEVTVTAYQDGNAAYVAATPVSYVFRFALPVREWVTILPKADDYVYTPSDSIYKNLVYVLDDNEYSSLYVPDEGCLFERELNVLLTIEADRWRTLVPAFDVDATYIVELVPEAILARLTRTEAIAMQRQANAAFYEWLGRQTAMYPDTSLLTLLATYLQELREKKGYAATEVGVYALEQYNETNSQSAHYYAYAVAEGEWNLSTETASGFVKEWQVENNTDCLLRRGAVYALRFPYYINCNPATSDTYDYWSGKCFLLHGKGGQRIMPSSSDDVYPADGKALLRGNGSLAEMILEGDNVYLHQTNPAFPYYDCYVRHEGEERLPPMSSVLYADVRNEAGVRARAVSRRGTVLYDTATDVTTHVPTIGNSGTLMYRIVPNGVMFRAEEMLSVAVYTVAGSLIWRGDIGADAECTVSLQSGVYVLQTCVGIEKVVVP